MGLKNKAWQVTKLEESRNSLLQENKQLMENISSLQLQIMDHNRTSLSLSSIELPKVCFLDLLNGRCFPLCFSMITDRE